MRQKRNFNPLQRQDFREGLPPPRASSALCYSGMWRQLCSRAVQLAGAIFASWGCDGVQSEAVCCTTG